MPESPRADKTFLVFAPLWRMHDALEKGALNAVFGKDIPVLSVKEQYGEARAATAALSAAYAAELLAGKAEAKGFNADNAEYILAVSFGLGGSYSAVVIKKA